VALQYFIIDEKPGVEVKLIDTRGRAQTLRVIPGMGWATAEAHADYGNVVAAWDWDDQVNWYNMIAAGPANAIMALIKGEAFLDELNEYQTLPTVVKSAEAFKLFGWVYVPYGAAIPASGELLQDPDEPEVTAIDVFDDEIDEDEEVYVAPEPALGGFTRWLVILGTGSLAGAVTWMLFFRD
jgi:hypothetical protein